MALVECTFHVHQGGKKGVDAEETIEGVHQRGKGSSEFLLNSL